MPVYQWRELTDITCKLYTVQCTVYSPFKSVLFFIINKIFVKNLKIKDSPTQQLIISPLFTVKRNNQRSVLPVYFRFIDIYVKLDSRSVVDIGINA